MLRLILIMTTLMMTIAVPAMADEEKNFPRLSENPSGTLQDTADQSCTELFDPFACNPDNPAVTLCAEEQRDCHKCFEGDVKRASWCAKRMGQQ